MKKLLLGTVGALALCAGPAHAEHFNGWYVGLEGGANWTEDWHHRQHTTSFGIVTDTDPAVSSFETGWAGLASVGYAFRDWRFELEGGYRRNNQHRLVDFRPTPFLDTTSGHIGTWSIMGNVLYDIPLTNRFSFTLGAGAGAARTQLDYQPALPGFRDSDWNFSYQGIAGLNYALGSRSTLFVDYRYFRVADPSFDFRNTQPQFLTGEDFVNHTATIGFRFALSPQEEEAPPPPPPAAPPPPPAPPPAVKHYVIFFGFNKCNITAEADGVLSQAASTAKSTGAASISIVGHTDTSGSSRYNQKLSVCRASAAKSNLVGKGIPAGSISIEGKGETELMVQTGDGVKEPQNRRATVDLQ
ncbi:MAG: outer membrane beta-barrel protein [Alphaproteobacteria bacterium]|nr:outer membrane beta-barrel protein [Alphaproteobacteria bacterium]